MGIIDLKNVSVDFLQKKKLVKAVDDVSLEIDKGDIYGVVGFSGAGKSTLVRTINLLQNRAPATSLLMELSLLKMGSKSFLIKNYNCNAVKSA